MRGQSIVPQQEGSIHGEPWQLHILQRFAAIDTELAEIQMALKHKTDARELALTNEKIAALIALTNEKIAALIEGQKHATSTLQVLKIVFTVCSLNTAAVLAVAHFVLH